MTKQLHRTECESCLQPFILLGNRVSLPGLCKMPLRDLTLTSFYGLRARPYLVGALLPGHCY